MVGSNTVNAIVRTLGSQAYTGTYDLAYSVNGGSNWVTQSVPASGLNARGNTQTVTFTTPWVIVAMGSQELRLRILPTVGGDPDSSDELVIPITPDVDVSSASMSDVTSLGGAATISATLVNSGGTNLNGTSIALHYSVNGGPFSAPQAFTPTTLGQLGQTETFSFSPQYTPQLQGRYTVLVRVAAPLLGDPDSADSATVEKNYVGYSTFAYGTGTTATASAPPIYRASETSTTDVAVYQMLYTAADLGNMASGSIIRGLSFNKSGYGESKGNDILKVFLRNLPITTTTYTNLSSTYGAETTGATLVLDTNTFRVPPTDGWFETGEFPIATPFVYTGGSLDVIVEYNCLATTPHPTTYSFSFLHNTAVTTEYRGRSFSGTAVPTATSALTINGLNSGTRRPHMRIHHQPGNVPAITTPVLLATADEGTPYTAQLAAVGGSGGPSYSWALATGSLPSGLSINPSTGEITGSPNANTASATPYVFGISATDASGTGLRNFSITVRPLSLATASGRLPDAEVGAVYSTSIAATGGGVSKSYAVTQGALPAGLTLGASTGTISGTPTIAAIQLGGHSFRITITSGSASVFGDYMLYVHPAAITYGTGTVNAEGGPPVSKTTASPQISYSAYVMMYKPTDLPTLAAGSVITSVAFYKEGTGASTGNDILRVWLRNTTSYGYSGGVVVTQFFHGATLVADYTNFKFPATSGWLEFGPFNTGNVFIHDGSNLEVLVEYNGHYNPAPTSTGGFSWRHDVIVVPQGARTQGLGYVPGNDFLPVPETSSLGNGGSNSGTRRPHIRLTTYVPTAPVVGGGNPAPADEGVAYSHAMAAVGGIGGSYTWSLVNGSLPTGLTLNPATGVISGTPGVGTRSATPYRFTVSAMDGSGTGTRMLELTVRMFGILTAAGELPNPVAGTAYAQTIAVGGGASPRSWALTTGTLPPGLTLNPATGLISGTPTLAGVTGSTYTFTITVTDGTSATLSATYGLTVLGPYFEYGQLATVAPNTGITVPPMIRNRAADTTKVSIFQMLYLSEDLSGLPPGSVIQGLSYLKDGYGMSLGNDILRIWLRNTNETVYFGSKTYQECLIGATQVANVNNFRMPPIDGWVPFGPFNTGNTFVYAGASLEITIEYDAVANTPPADDLFAFRNNVIPVDNRGRSYSGTTAPTATSVVQINLNSSGVRRPLTRFHHFAPLTPAIASNSPGPADEGVSYSYQPTATGGAGGPWTWSIINGTLPNGLTLNTATGAITGTPANATLSQVPYFFTLRATDGTGTGSFNTSITVRALGVPFGILTLPSAATGVAYHYQLQFHGGAAGPKTFSLSSGVLPAGLSLNPTTGVISGTPTLSAASATPYTFTSQVNDGTSFAGSVLTMMVNTGVIEFGTGTTSAATLPPIYRPSAASTADVSVTQSLYYASELSSLPPGSLLNSIAWFKTNDGASVAGAEHTLQIWLRNTSDIHYYTSPTFAEIIAGATLVYDNTLFAMPATIGWITIPFNITNQFIYTGGNLEVIVHFDCTSTAGNPTTNSFNWRNDVIAVADHRGRGVNPTTTIAPVTAVTVNNISSGIRRPHVQFGVGFAAPTDVDVRAVSFGNSRTAVPVIGSNTVHVEVRNTGSTAYSGPVVLEYSGNGAPFVTQSFNFSTATGIGSSEVFTFTTPWVLTGSGASLEVRINPPVTGDPDSPDSVTFTFPADLDITAIALQTGGDPVFGNNTIVATVANRGVMVLSGQSFSLQFSSNNGNTWTTPQSFAATSIAMPGQSANFTITTPWNVTTVSNTNLLVRFAPQMAGDPDASDEFARLYLATGAAFEMLPGAFEFPSIVGLPAAGSNGYPFNTVWEDQRLEAIYLASELTAAGLYPGALITGLQLKCAQLPGMEVQNFRIRIQNTNLSQHALVAYTPSGFTNCFGPTTIPLSEFVVNGWVRFPFHTSYTWDGISNLKVDFSTDGAAFVSGGGCFLRETPGQWRSIVGYEDSLATFPFNEGMLQLIPKTNVPSLRIEFPLASNPGILVSRAGIIPDGNVDEHFDSLTATIAKPLSYTIRNYGTSASLNVTAVNITGATNCTAVLTTSPVGSPIGVGLTGTMLLTVTPSAGAWSFNVELVNNASATMNQSYTFTVQGVGYVNHAPVIEAPVAAVTGRVLITEVVVNDAQAGGWSFFELTNFGGTPIDVTGWEVWIWDGTGIAPFGGVPASLTNLGSLPPGLAYVIGESTPGIYLPNVFSINPPHNWSWSSGSGGVMVRDAQQNVVDCVYWGLSTPATITVPMAVGANWTGNPAPAIAVNVPIWRNTLNDTNSAADWITGPSLNLGQANAPYWTLPRARPNSSVTQNGQNYELVTYTGESLLTFLRANDEDGSRQQLTLTATVTGGTLTPAQAGFTTTFPATATNGSSPRVLTFDGTAIAPGTVIFNIVAADNSDLPLQHSYQLTIRIDSAARVDAMMVDSPYGRANGRRDLFRGGTVPIDLTLSNPNPFAVTVSSVQVAVRAKSNNALLAAISAPIIGGPVTIPANTPIFLAEASMTIPTNTPGTNGQAVIISLTGGLASDPVTPTNLVGVLIYSGTDELDLYSGTIPSAMVLGFSTVAPAVETVPYNQLLSVTGGSGSYTWSLSPTSVLPAGLTLNPQGSIVLPATISGTPAADTSLTSPYPLTLTVSDNTYQRTIQVTMTVSLATPLVFPPVTLANGQEFVPYTMTTPFTASGGALIYVFTVDPGSTDQLPTGLSLHPVTGVISGTPANGTQDTYDITFAVNDGQTTLTQNVTFIITPHVLEWRGTTLPPAEVTVAYNHTLDAIGGTGPRIYSYAPTTAQQLPAGLTFSAATGVISGSPLSSTVGTYTITFRVTDGLNATADRTFTLGVALPPPLAITTTELPYSVVGQAITGAIVATGGSRNYTFTIGTNGDDLPTGITLAANGTFSGTPLPGQDGRYELDVMVGDGFGSVNKTVILPILAADSASVVVSEVDTQANYVEITNTSQTPIDVSGWTLRLWVNGTTPVAFPFTTLPGASLAVPGEVATLTVGGTPGGFWPNFNMGGSWTATNSSSIAAQLLDIHGNTIDFIRFGTVTVAALVDGANAPLSLPTSLATRPAAATYAANRSLGAFGFVASPAGSPGQYNPDLTSVALTILKDGIRDAQEGQAYRDFVIATGGLKPYTFSLVAPAATWLSIDPNTGEITGTPPASSAGSVVADVSVTDATLAIVTSTLNFSVLASSAPVAATFTVGTGEGQSFEGTVINVPVTLSRAVGTPAINDFTFVITIPAPTAAELSIYRVLPGAATTAAGLSVISRDLGGNRVFVSSIDTAAAATPIADGVVAIVQFIVPINDTIMAPTGTYNVGISDTDASTGVSAILASGVPGQMVLSNFKPQDVNRDTAIDVVDVQLTVNLILALQTPTYAGQGDANQDNAVDVVDVQTIVNCILLGGC